MRDPFCVLWHGQGTFGPLGLLFHISPSKQQLWMLPASWFVGRGSGWYQSYSSWGWSLVVFSSYLIAYHPPPQPLLKRVGETNGGGILNTQTVPTGATSRDIHVGICLLWLKKMFNQNSRSDTLNVKHRALHYTTGFISQGEEHQGLWGHRLDESHLTWLQLLSHF